MRSPSFAAIAFLSMAFLAVGLAGVLATYAAPLPLARALAREDALDEATLAAGRRDAAALEALRPRLGDSAEAILPPSPDFAARVAQERAAVRARFAAEADASADRLRFLVAVVTVMAAAFGAVVLRFSGREIR
ncbi:MAG: hypothetical protein JOY70_01450 [Acidisphaera sp.]|nr:hypothetical protein [Acidisphaera sp.]MBV9812913.1 hypothetical protein [Acetobacteraceae bacterium]